MINKLMKINEVVEPIEPIKPKRADDLPKNPLVDKLEKDPRNIKRPTPAKAPIEPLGKDEEDIDSDEEEMDEPGHDNDPYEPKEPTTPGKTSLSSKDN
jgi:hypothetical protein